MRCIHNLESKDCASCIKYKEMRRKWLKGVQDTLIYGSRGWEWFEIKLMKLDGRKRRMKYVQELPLP